MASPVPPDAEEVTAEGDAPEAATGAGDGADRPRWVRRTILFGRCLLAGLTIAASVPPWGWWPLAFLGIFQWDRLLAGRPWASRFRRTWLIVAAWLLPAMAWMLWLTPPGYAAAVAGFAAYFGVAAALTPSSRWRWLGLPGAIVLAELARWSFPWEGVPLATLAMSQGASPFAASARLGGAILVSAVVAVGGVALSAAWERQWGPAAVGLAIAALLTLGGLVAPRGEDLGPLRIAVVQGGGPQGVVGAGDEAGVFQRHLDATRAVRQPVDLVVWPENTVAINGTLPGTEEDRRLSDLARQLHAPLVVGVTEDVSLTQFTNAAVVYLPDGQRGDRFDKVTRVPFGEWVPFRPLIEKLAAGSGIPYRDAIPGTGPAVIRTPAGTMGVVISWEVFFSGRAQDAAANGGEVLLNPTNGSSYSLTEVQSQQIAASRLRAIETGRWVVQSAPTGFSAFVDPSGALASCEINGARVDVCRTGVGETAVLEGTVQRRTGTTIATAVGPWPVLALAVLALGSSWLLQARSRRRRS